MRFYGRWDASFAANGAVGRPSGPMHSTLPPPFVAVVPGDDNNKHQQRRSNLRRAVSEGRMRQHRSLNVDGKAVSILLAFEVQSHEMCRSKATYKVEVGYVAGIRFGQIGVVLLS